MDKEKTFLEKAFEFEQDAKNDITNSLHAILCLQSACNLFKEVLKEEVRKAKREMAEKAIEIAKESISSGFDCLGCDKRDNLIFDEFILAIRYEAEKE